MCQTVVMIGVIVGLAVPGETATAGNDRIEVFGIEGHARDLMHPARPLGLGTELQLIGNSDGICDLESEFGWRPPGRWRS